MGEQVGGNGDEQRELNRRSRNAILGTPDNEKDPIELERSKRLFRI